MVNPPLVGLFQSAPVVWDNTARFAWPVYLQRRTFGVFRYGPARKKREVAISARTTSKELFKIAHMNRCTDCLHPFSPRNVDLSGRSAHVIAIAVWS
jgi:hypothetical protein